MVKLTEAENGMVVAWAGRRIGSCSVGKSVHYTRLACSRDLSTTAPIVVHMVSLHFVKRVVLMLISILYDKSRNSKETLGGNLIVMTLSWVYMFMSSLNNIH